MRLLNYHAPRESGSALIISLVILLVLTIIGVSSIGSTNLEERMAQNFENSELTFQAAESAITNVIHASDPGGAGANSNPFYDQTTDPIVAAMTAGLNDTSTVVADDLDPYGHLTNATLTANSTVVYKGNSGICPEASSGPFTCYYFEITTQADSSELNTKATHVQGIYRVAPSP
jgi:Tfp pilus assembly protein PilX